MFGTKPGAPLMFGAPAQPSTGMFGSVAQPTSAPSMFGATQPASAPSMFGSTSQPAAPAASMFGAPAQTAAPSMFGSTPQPVAPTASMFGASAQAAVPAASMFGATSTPAQPSMFGSTPAPAQPGLFGATPAAAPSTGMFGATQPTATPSMFGTTQPAAASSNFGATQPTPAPSVFGFAPAAATTQTQPSMLGATQQQPQGALAKETKYDELSEPSRAAIDEIERFIQSQINQAQSLHFNSNHKMILQVASDSAIMHSKLKIVKNIIGKDKAELESLRKAVMQEFRNADLGARYIERHLHPHLTSYGARQDEDTTRYFDQVTTTLEQRVRECATSIAQIELFIAQQDNGAIDLSTLTYAIKTQYPSFIETANSVADVHERVVRLIEQVELFRRRKYGNEYELSKPAQSRGVNATPLKTIANSMQQYMTLSYPQQAPAAAGAGLFGASTTAAPSMFGSKPAAAPGLFGAPTAQPGLFGSTPAASSMFNAPAAPAAPSMFGSAPAAPSLFGATAAAPGLFGSSTANSGMFGSGAKRVK